MSSRRDGWEDGMIDGERASVREDGDRVEAVWPVDENGEGVDPHNHIVANDGLNGSYYRPAGETPVVDDNPDARTYTGHVAPEGSSDRIEMNAARMRDASRGQTRPTRRQRDEQKFYPVADRAGGGEHSQGYVA